MLLETFRFKKALAEKAGLVKGGSWNTQSFSISVKSFKTFLLPCRIVTKWLVTIRVPIYVYGSCIRVQLSLPVWQARNFT